MKKQYVIEATLRNAGMFCYVCSNGKNNSYSSKLTSRSDNDVARFDTYEEALKFIETNLLYEKSIKHLKIVEVFFKEV